MTKFQVVVSIPPITVEATQVADSDIGLVIGPVRTRSFTAVEEIAMATVELTDLQEVRVSISPQDAMGNPGVIDGVPTWESSDPSILTVSPTSPDGLMADAVTVGPLGTATVTVTADADLGDGMQPITGTVDFVVVGSVASSLNVAVGTPTDRPTP